MEARAAAVTFTTLEKRLRWAGVLIAAGLVVQLITLEVLHPLAFVAFLGVACPLIAAGIALFSYAILKSQ